jgi:hypothetical protein
MHVEAASRALFSREIENERLTVWLSALTESYLPCQKV